jgi:putative Mg2+ transporter-C (MgtC) family protein
MMPIEFEVESLGRVFGAMILSGLLGWEREIAGKEAGLRTHILVGMGSALFVVLAHLIIRDFSRYGDTQQFDPTRTLEAVATGVSFLGAGVIVFRRGRDTVQGLTTAASLWATAAVAVSVALGEYVLAVGCTVLLLVVLRLMIPLERRIRIRREGRPTESAP